MANANVVFTVTNASYASFSPVTVPTNAAGDANTIATAGSLANANYTVTATSTGTPGTTFTLTNIAGPANKMVLLTGDLQSTTVNTNFAASLAVQVTDANNNPVKNATVNFASQTASNANSIIASPTVLTDVNGRAATLAQANGKAGPYTATAASSGTPGQTFRLTNTPGAPVFISALSGNNQTATVNTVYNSNLIVLV